MFRFVGKLWRHAGKMARKWKPDVVITSSTYPLDTYAGRRIAKRSGARLIHEVHDLWPLTLTEVGGISRHHPFVLLLQMAEKWGITVIDLWHDPEMNRVSPDDYRLYMNDGVHPTKAGYLLWWTPALQRGLYRVFGE